MRILIPVLVGSLIGYFTNWLAVKMLFRPHYEKKIFGIALPFTPGLIPKERGRMAKNIGSAVGEHLLTTDTIIDAISKDENEEKIKAWIKDEIHSLRQNQSTVNQYLKEKIGNKDLLIGNAKKKVSNYIISSIRSQQFKDNFKKLVEKTIKNYNTDDLYNNFNVKATDLLEEIKESDGLRKEIEKVAHKILKETSKNDKALKEVISEDIFISINKYLDTNKDEIGDKIRNILKDKEVNDKMHSTISKLVFDRSNKLLMAFLSPDIISEKIVDTIEKYVQEKETNEDIIDLIKFVIEKTKEKKLSQIAKFLTKLIDDKSMKKISNKIVYTALNDENIKNIIGKSLEHLRENESSNKENLITYIWNRIENTIDSKSIENKINRLLEESIDELENTSISSLVNKLNDERISKLYDIFKNIFNEFAKTQLPQIIDMLNVSKIVEEKINSFDIDYAEKLILDIAKQELNQITRLGALIGAFLGLISPLLQKLY